MTELDFCYVKDECFIYNLTQVKTDMVINNIIKSIFIKTPQKRFKTSKSKSK